MLIDTSLQAYKGSGSGAVPVGGNVRISKCAWDPVQPGAHLGGLSQHPCAGATDPCQAGDGFIGDDFGAARRSRHRPLTREQNGLFGGLPISWSDMRVSGSCRGGIHPVAVQQPWTLPVVR